MVEIMRAWRAWRISRGFWSGLVRVVRMTNTGVSHDEAVMRHDEAAMRHEEARVLLIDHSRKATHTCLLLC